MSTPERTNPRELMNKFLAASLLVGVWFVIVATAPVWLPLDFVLRRIGRRGFIVVTDAAVEVQLGPGAFERVSHEQ